MKELAIDTDSLKRYLDFQSEIGEAEIYSRELKLLIRPATGSIAVSQNKPSISQLFDKAMGSKPTAASLQEKQTSSKSKIPDTIQQTQPSPLSPEILKILEEPINLDEFYNKLECLDLYKKNNLKPINYSGLPKAPIALVSLFPLPEDEKNGKLFSGSSSILLENMFKAIDLGMEDIYTTAVVKSNHLFTQSTFREKGVHLKLLYKELSLISSRVILLFGEGCAQLFLKTGMTIDQLRLQNHPASKYDILGEKTVLVTYHPNQMEKNKEMKLKAWDDLKWLQKVLNPA